MMEFWRGYIAGVISAILPSLVFGALALRYAAARADASFQDEDR